MADKNGDEEVGGVPSDQFLGAGIAVIVSMCVRFDRPFNYRQTVMVLLFMLKILYRTCILQIRIFYTYIHKLGLKLLFMMMFVTSLVRSVVVLKVIKKTQINC